MLSAGCGDDDATTRRRDVTFELTGNFSGSISVTYLQADGGVSPETIPGLPWTKTVSYQPSVLSTLITLVGINGTAGQSITVRVVAGGKQQSSTIGTADATGRVAISSPVVIF